MSLRDVSRMEHDLGLLPCSDTECPVCTGVSRVVAYDFKTDSYDLITVDNGISVRTRVARQVFEAQDAAIAEVRRG